MKERVIDLEKYKILFITGHEFLYNPQNGGQKCSLRNYTLLQDIFGEENVSLCMFSNYDYVGLHTNVKIFPTQKNKIELLINTVSGRNVCNFKVWKDVYKYINSQMWDLIFCDSSTIGGMLKKIKSDAVKIVFFHNIERNYALNKVKHDGLIYLVPFFSYRRNEYNAFLYADYCIYLNERDRKIAEGLYQKKEYYTLPITFRDCYDENNPILHKSDRKTLLFVGSFFSPNYQGIKWFIEEVMPGIPDFTLKIVGKNMEKKRGELERENVEVIGTVNDLMKYYAEADAVVMPIFFGDGMKVKTAEAMMYGKKIFASREALEGYDIDKVRNNGIFECNNKEEFITAISHFGQKQGDVEERMRRFFLENYETEKVRESFKSFLISCIKNKKRIGEK